MFSSEQARPLIVRIGPLAFLTSRALPRPTICWKAVVIVRLATRYVPSGTITVLLVLSAFWNAAVELVVPVGSAPVKSVTYTQSRNFA